MSEKRTYVTDGIDDFIALYGFAEAASIVSRALKIPLKEAEERLYTAQRNLINEI